MKFNINDKVKIDDDIGIVQTINIENDLIGVLLDNKKICSVFSNYVGLEKINDSINNPSHYGGADNPYEAIKIIEHYELGFCLGNVLKYVLRAGKKDPKKHIEDLKKSVWYLNREISNLEKEGK